MTIIFNNAQDLVGEDYFVLGMSTCFVREEGEIFSIKVIEPLPYPALAALIKGSPTAYQMVIAKSLGEIFPGENPQKTAEFPEDAQFCPDFTQRTISATRTYKNNTQAKSLLPLGSMKTDFNFSQEKKRTLNANDFILEKIVLNLSIDQDI